VSLLLAIAGGAVGQTSSGDGSNSAPRLAPHIEAILKLVPAEAPMAIIVPDLKAASNELTRLTEGMDRANLLLGLRPLDHLKSATGFNTGINDVGAAAQIILPPKDSSQRSILIIPVTDAKAFISGNFSGEKDGGHVRGDGTMWYVKELGSHVAVSASPGVVDLAADGGLDRLVLARSTRGVSSIVSWINVSDAFVITNPQAVAVDSMVGPPITDDQRQRLARHMKSMEIAVVTFDFDPLAVVMRSFAAFKPDSEIGKLLNSSEGRVGAATLNALPDKPYYIAGAVDVRGMGGAATLLGLLEQATGQPAAHAQQMESFDQLQFAAYPSPAGLAGGLLNDSALFIETSPPTSAGKAVKAIVQDAPNFPDGVKREVKWEDAREVKDVGPAAAYEIKNVNVPPALVEQQMIAGMIYGRAGLRGFVRPTATGAIVTFSQRPAVLKAAVEADAAREVWSGLQGDAVLRSMREWMPEQTDAIGFIDIGQLLKFGLAIADNFGMRDAIPLPPLNDSLPPIGFSMNVDDGAVAGTTIIPAGVVAVLADVAIRTKADAVKPNDAAQPEAGHR